MAEPYDCGGLGCGHQPCICPTDRDLFPEAHAAIADGLAEAVADLVSTERRPLVIMFRPCSRCGEAVGSLPEQTDASIVCSRCAARRGKGAR